MCIYDKQSFEINNLLIATPVVIPDSGSSLKLVESRHYDREFAIFTATDSRHCWRPIGEPIHEIGDECRTWEEWITMGMIVQLATGQGRAEGRTIRIHTDYMIAYFVISLRGGLGNE